MLPRLASSARWRTVAAGGIVAVFAAHFSWVRDTNWGGYDEWLHIWLSSRGIFSFPYANRPLDVVWAAPAMLLPDRLWFWWLLRAAYLCGAGLLTFTLCLEIAPHRRRLAFLAGVLACTWAPADLARLQFMQTIAYAGCLWALLAATLLLVRSWRDGRLWLLAAAAILIFIAGRSHEAVLPLAATAPLLLPFVRRAGQVRPAVWLATWWTVVAIAAALFIAPLLSGGSYQGAMGFDRSLLHAAVRLREQFVLHLAPLFRTTFVPVPAAIAALIMGAAVLALQRAAPEQAAPPRHEWLLTIAGGLTLAAIGYLPFLFSPSVVGAARTEFLSAPGIALALAAAICGVSALAPAPTRTTVAALLAAAVAATGASATATMQRTADSQPWFFSQREVLREVVRAVPDVEPHTLLILLDRTQAFPATFSFHPAIASLYEGRASGWAYGAWTHLFRPSFVEDGVYWDVWPTVRQPWGQKPTLFAWSEIVVFRYDGAGTGAVARSWPPELPPLTPGAAYAPESRIRRSTPRAASRHLLD